MRISVDWLADYVALPPGLKPEQIATDLTMATVEVEGVVRLGRELEWVKIARVVSVDSLPGQSSAKLVTCDSGAFGLKEAVSTASNVRPGMLMPVVLDPGHANSSQVIVYAPADDDIRALFPNAKPGDVLDLSETEATPGDDLSDVIRWSDVVLEIDNKSLTHRPDLWGHYGIARELAAIYSCTLNPLPLRDPAIPKQRLVGALDSACNRFAAVRISGVENRQAPLWMRSRLVKVGQRPVDVLVDLTNYVMLAVGQPMHVFDADKLDLPLGVRRAAPSERLSLLDGQSYLLDSSMLVVADREGAHSLAGIMGGAASAVSASTCETILETANFDAATVRRASARLSLRSEASARFEKALDTQRVDEAVALFLALLREVQPSSTVVGFDDVHPTPTKKNHIVVDVGFLQSRLGKALNADELCGLLRRLEFEVTTDGDRLIIDVPTWRSTGDVSIPADILEEVARLYGYENFEFKPPAIRIEGPSLNRLALTERRIKEVLAFSGDMQEVVTYPWVEDHLLTAAGMDERDTLRLAAAPAPNQSRLRPSLIPSLLKSVATNLRYFDSFRIFEAGGVFADIGYRSVDSERELLPLQRRSLGGALVGSDAEALFLDAKGLIETIQRTAHVKPLEFVRNVDAGWAEARARLGLMVDGRCIGALGVLTRRAKTLADIKRSQVVLFEFDLNALEPLPSRENSFQELPEFPEIDLDLSLLFPEEIEWATITPEVRAVDELIREVSYVDKFRGKGIPESHKSLTLRLRLGSKARTLTVEEGKQVADRVAKALGVKFGARARA
jgi:phenylalanyl-tRNA synthetase beta chain